MALAGHVQGIVRQPAAVLRLQRRPPPPGPAPSPGPWPSAAAAKPAVRRSAAVVHVPGIGSPVLGSPPPSRVSSPSSISSSRSMKYGLLGIGGKALIGGVAVAGGAQRQHLPAVLARRRGENRQSHRRPCPESRCRRGTAGRNTGIKMPLQRFICQSHSLIRNALKCLSPRPPSGGSMLLSPSRLRRPRP